MVTDATPEELLKLFPRARIVGRRFPIVHVYFNQKEYIEVSTFRGKEELDEEIPENYGTPEEDAKRRDLTINALFYDPFEDKIYDYVGGLEDLKKGIIRCIGNPEERYQKDPVRMLRVIRHAARTGFEIEEKTWEDLKKCRALIKSVPRERLRDELLKDLSGFWLAKWFFLLKESGLLYELYPFYQHLEKNPLFSERFLWKILKLLEQSDFSLEVRLALFAYAFLPLIQRPYEPNPKQNMPSFERKEILRLFWALFYTFRFQRALFERAIDLFSDLYKLLYLKLKNKEIPRRFRKKPYYPELVELLEKVFPLIKTEKRKLKGEKDES